MYDRVPRERVWNGIRKSGVAEDCVRLRGQCKSGMVCEGIQRWIQGKGGIVSKTDPEPFLFIVVVNEAKQESQLRSSQFKLLSVVTVKSRMRKI